ncbi:MAG: fused MFS/spermidine synthase [Sphingomonadaceae bacterium]|nr:fused MFS/spermidine synthase [Sphingomonadaceae bacterium]
MFDAMVDATPADAARAAAARRLRTLFAVTIGMGSFLLFLLEPMFARLVLPRLGGAPAVWNSALLFYQAALFVGYLWAHLLARLPVRRQLALHAGLLAAAALALPVAVTPPPSAWQSANPALWLPALFALSVGPLFVTVAAQAPLLQAWFARTGERPFFLYAASNAGSLAALIAYPLIVEPNVATSAQTAGWSGLYLALAALTAFGGLVVMRAAPAAAVDAALAPAAVPLRRRLRWAALAAVPSGLLISTTSWLTTDVMSMPLFWVIPLALYLLSFIIAFGGGAAVLQPARVAPVLLIVLGAPVFLVAGGAATIAAGAGLVLLFYIALALHTELAADAPEGGQATRFYLWLAGGGVIGGVLPALAGPVMFDWTWEHPILLLAAALLLPATPVSPLIGRLWTGRLQGLLTAALPLFSLALGWWLGTAVAGPGDLTERLPLAALLMLAALLAIGRPAMFAWAFLCLLAGLGGIHAVMLSRADGARTRSFFGVYTVQDRPSRGTRELLHGTTLHGAQSLLPQFKTRPTTYYYPGSGLGRVLAAAPRLFARPPRIGVVGLGTGTTACWRTPGEQWTYFEIDPAVVRIARDPKRFTYLSSCAPDARIVLGDARLRVAEVPRGGFDVMALDAFSSDAIPVHLLTHEAFAAYRGALADDGLLLVHISNRFVALEPVVAAMAARDGWSGWISERGKPGARFGTDDSGADWILLAKSHERARAVIDRLPPGEWRPIAAPARFRPWSDDFASILPIIK